MKMPEKLQKHTIAEHQTHVEKHAFTEFEAAIYIGMSVAHLRKNRLGIADNVQTAPPFVRIGRSIRYLKTDLDDWLKMLKLQQPMTSQNNRY